MKGNARAALSILAILVPILLGCLLVLLTSLILWGIWRREELTADGPAQVVNDIVQEEKS